MRSLVLEHQFRYVLVDAVLVAFAFRDELHDLEIGAADDVADLQELRRLAQVDGVDAECVCDA